jgi:hypothetical protein
VDVVEAMTYRGKHALLISQTGGADTVDVRKGLSAMRAQSVIYLSLDAKKKKSQLLT